MIGRSLNADLRKMKGTSVILAHLLIPIITSVIFLIYYFFSPWNENMKVIAFYQAIGAGLPVLIGIFTASVMEQEQNAGDFQNLLSLSDKPVAFLEIFLQMQTLSLSKKQDVIPSHRSSSVQALKVKILYVKREKFRPEKQLLWKLSRNKKSEDIVPESV